MKQTIVSFLGNAECKHCHLPLRIIDRREKIIELSNDGTIQCAYSDNDIRMECNNCNRVYDYIQVSDNKYKIYTDLEQKLDIYNMVENYNFDGIDSPFVKKGDI